MWHGSWFEHQNLRDDRAEAFTSLLQGERASLHVHGAGDHPGPVRGAAPTGGGDVSPGDVRVRSRGGGGVGLIKKRMIWSPAHGETAFTVPLFDEFMRREIREWHSVGSTD
jgi:hypothetical protein